MLKVVGFLFILAISSVSGQSIQDPLYKKERISHEAEPGTFEVFAGGSSDTDNKAIFTLSCNLNEIK